MQLVDRDRRKFITMFVGVIVLFVAVMAALAEGVKKGQPFPALDGFGLEGTLPELKGKVVMVDFWASWCGPCKESFPVMNELQKKYAEQGLVIVAINVEENKSDMDAFLKEHPAAFAVLRDARQKLVDKVSINTMPSSFILDREGRVAASHSGFAGDATHKQYETEIAALLK